MQRPDRSIKTIRGKIVIALIIACGSLLLAWSISRVTFREMLQTVNLLKSPNEKLTLVNDIYRDITLLDQLHRNTLISSANEKTAVEARVRILGSNLDSLRRLYPDYPAQQARISKVTSLVKRREQLFSNFLKVRDGLISNKAFSEKLASINGVIVENVPKAGPTTITTIKESKHIRYSDPEPENKGFWSKIFGGKKKQTPVGRTVDRIDEELDITTDTIASAHNDTIIDRVERAVNEIRSSQQKYGAAYLANQAALADAGNKLTGRMMTILNEVEGEVLRQSELSSRNAESVVETSVNKITLILVIFVLVTLVLLVLILTDIARSSRYRTQLESARDEALYHSAAKQRFLANISHELRTPLQAIVGYSELIKDQERPSPEHLSAIYYSSNHLLQIVNEVLDYSRIVSGKFTLAEEQFELGKLLDEVSAVLRIKAMEKSILFLTDYEEVRNLTVFGDPFRLKQILFNLLGNAVKYTEQGQVKLSVHGKRSNVQSHLNIRVDDTGRGIAKENLPHIFNEFDQGGVSEENLLSGSGLGLNIVKSLTEIQGGRIYVESEPAVGSSFILYLTYKLVQAEPLRSEGSVEAAEMFDGKVWVVDDDPFILQFCKSVLEKNNISHTCFYSAQSVLDMPWDPEVRLLFLDKRMPGMDGFQLLQIIRPRIPAGVRVYALTAQAMPDEIESFKEKGFDGVLLKPFREKDLLGLMKMAAATNRQSETSNRLLDTADLSGLKAMTFGDEEEMLRILELFIRDSESDLEEILAALGQNDLRAASLPIHRLAGRTGQIGARDLAEEFRRLETDLESPTLHVDWTARLLSQIGALRHWFEQLKKLIEAQQDLPV